MGNVEMSADELKQIRNKLGLTQEGFARLVGMTTGQISCYERGKTPISSARAALFKLKTCRKSIKGVN